MKKPEQAILVEDIAGKRALLDLDNATGEQREAIFSLGFRNGKDGAEQLIVDEDSRLKLIQDLIDLRALFEGGPGWSPAQLVAHYKDLGKVQGAFSEIAWRSPSEFVVYQHD